MEDEFTLGGRPRFFFGVSEAETSAAKVVPFLFLLPLGRPRPRLTGAPLASAAPTKKKISIASDKCVYRVTG
jgi:hypothetical protein